MARRIWSLALASGLAVSLAACGGGGGSDDGGGEWPAPAPPSVGWGQGVFLPSAQFKNQCANPRRGTDASGRPYADVQGALIDENHWLRSWTNELYLWYDEVVDRNPANFSSTAAYFDVLKTTQTTASGEPKDKFHFTWPTAEWESFSQSGVTAGYGAMFVLVRAQPPRELRVAYVEASSPASAAGLSRGDEILSIDGVDVIYGSNTAALDAGLFPSHANETHTFVVRNSSGSRSVAMQSANVPSAPVHTVRTISTPSGPVGYMLFNDHIATAEGALIDAIDTLKAGNIVDLVLDIRYNGGGYLAIASQLAYMIAGSARTAGQTFERSVWNDKHTATNPVTGEPLAPTPFVTQTVGLSRPAGTALPTLNLDRLFVLTTGGTCSASEAIINGLRGVDVEVIQVGTTTCGKPYGFYAFDNCGTTYFSVQFKTVNAKNFGDYGDGFSPANTQQKRGTIVPGCSVDDDLTRELGNENERLLSVALAYRASGQCSLPPAAAVQTKPAMTVEGAALARPPYREIRLMHHAEP